jgi:hypothetical protein
MQAKGHPPTSSSHTGARRKRSHTCTNAGALARTLRLSSASPLCTLDRTSLADRGAPAMGLAGEGVGEGDGLAANKPTLRSRWTHGMGAGGPRNAAVPTAECVQRRPMCRAHTGAAPSRHWGGPVPASDSADHDRSYRPAQVLLTASGQRHGCRRLSGKQRTEERTHRRGRRRCRGATTSRRCRGHGCRTNSSRARRRERLCRCACFRACGQTLTHAPTHAGTPVRTQSMNLSIHVCIDLDPSIDLSIDASIDL